MMHSISRIRASWQTMQSEKTFPPTRRSMLRSFFAILLVTLATALVVGGFFLSITRWLPPRNRNLQYRLKEDALKHFVHQRECPVTQSSVYHIPITKATPPTSPFCENRATLLKSINEGSRSSFDEPFIGNDCIYKWFSTPEICMILERHNAITFIGDETAQVIYLALNILLSEDLGLGGLQNWRLGEEDKAECMCENQFSKQLCLKHAVKSSQETKRNGGRNNAYYCGRVKHAYIPATTTPAPLTSVNIFKDYTYEKPHPWQPSPLIISFTKDAYPTTLALSEWVSLAAGAKRNIPMLFLGAHAGKEKSGAIEQEQREIAESAREMHFEVLQLWNLTSQMSEGVEMGVAIVEAMMVVNWLSKVPSS